MKFQLSSKYFRIRSVIWLGIFCSIIFSTLGLFSVGDNSTFIFAVICFSSVPVFLLLSIASFRTYKAEFLSYDKARWNRKGFDKKLQVISDWVIR